MAPAPPSTDWYAQARYGMFIHFGLYSLLGRAEWVLNREQIPIPEYKKLADRFDCAKFDAEALADLAVRSGMTYVTLTTMHHDGFRLYDTALSNFSTARTAARRDLVQEMVNACRKRGLKIALYHSLNNWTDQPDSVDALEDPRAYETFIKAAFDRLRELATKYKPFDVMWYDGWWPFNAERWRGEEMNAMIRQIQPHILFNGRNGLPGDFATPEGHVAAPKPWRPWEACMTLNNSWGYHAGDHDWKNPGQVVDLLVQVANGRGNLLLNVGPRGDGSLPEETVRILEAVGAWKKRQGDLLDECDEMSYSLMERGTHRGDWCTFGSFLARKNRLSLVVRRWPGTTCSIGGFECKVKKATLVGNDTREVKFTQTDGRVTLSGLPEQPNDAVAPVIHFECDRPPVLYLSGGMRVPKVEHPHYDPCPSDIAHPA